MSPPDTPAAPVDPNLQAEQDRAQADLVKSLQGQAAGDQASLMARYGTQLALAGAGGGTPVSTGSPLSAGFAPIGRGM